MQQYLNLFDDEENSPDCGTINPSDLEMEKLNEFSILAYDAVNFAGMNCLTQNISRYVKKVLDAAEKTLEKSRIQGRDEPSAQIAAREAADRAALDRGDPIVREVLTSVQKASWEVHRIMGFLRFAPVEQRAKENAAPETFYLALCAPDNFILPCLAEHFTLRFGDKPWAIIDEKRGLILIRRSGTEASLETLDKEVWDSACIDSENNDIENFWRLYHRSIFIENRKNLNLQRQFIPLRYRKYLTEFQ